MDYQLFMRYLLEYAMLLPAVVLALMPTANHLRFNASNVYGAAFISVVGLAMLGSLVSTAFALPTKLVLIPCALVLLAGLWYVSTLQPAKKLHCFLNAITLYAFSAMYTSYITAPWELGNADGVLTMQSAAVGLLVGCLVCLIFARTLILKLPSLFEHDSLNSLWKWIAFGSIAIISLLLWLAPVNVENVLTGYVRPKSIATMLLIPAALWLIYHVSWITASRMAEGEAMKREFDLLKMEEKRHLELLGYIDEARAMRHDFRHHMTVVGELASSGKADEAAAYAGQFIETTNAGHARMFCENSSIDAIAAHFDSIASAKGVSATWILDIPDEIPTDEADFCSVLANLTENALISASKCDEGARWLRVKASFFSGDVLTLLVENSFTGVIKMGANGLPQSNRAGHGIGLASVAAIVRKHNGSFSVSTEGSTFTATVVLYPN